MESGEDSYPFGHQKYYHSAMCSPWLGKFGGVVRYVWTRGMVDGALPDPLLRVYSLNLASGLDLELWRLLVSTKYIARVLHTLRS